MTYGLDHIVCSGCDWSGIAAEFAPAALHDPALLPAFGRYLESCVGLGLLAPYLSDVALQHLQSGRLGRTVEPPARVDTLCALLTRGGEFWWPASGLTVVSVRWHRPEGSSL